MKIAFIMEHFNPAFGGQEVYMRDFSNFLISKGHEVHLYTQTSNSSSTDLQVHLIKVPKWKKLMRWTQWLSFLAHAKKQVKADGYDVVMGTGMCLGVSVYQPHGGVNRASHRQNALLTGPLIAKLKHFSNLFSPKHVVSRWVEKQKFSDPQTHFIAISEMVKGHMKEFYAVADDRMTLIYNGVDVERFRPASQELKSKTRTSLGLPQDKVIFSLVAHNFRLKGLAELVKAAALIRNESEDFLIVIAGKGKRKKYESKIKALGLSEYFHFLGSVSEPELVYQATDVYLQPTWYDPCSLVVLEAMAAGLPVITTEFNGAGELIDDGVSGYVINAPSNIEALADGMKALLDRDKRISVGQEARVKIEPYTLQRNYEAMLQAFETHGKIGSL